MKHLGMLVDGMGAINPDGIRLVCELADIESADRPLATQLLSAYAEGAIKAMQED